MGGTITHLVIADKILERLPSGIITDAGMFYAGSLAPDAIHARHGYVRDMKKHTHMRDDIRDSDFLLPHNRELFHERLDSFIQLNFHWNGGMLDVYKGYITHLLSDEIFVMTARQKLVEKVLEEGIGQHDREFVIRFAHDIHNNDIILAQSYPEIKKIKESIESVGEFEIKDYLTQDEIKRSRLWVIDKFLENPREPDKPVYITPQDIENYINESVEYVTNYIY